MEGIRERYERSLQQRADNYLEEAKAEFWTKIATAINESKICESGANRYDKEIHKDQEYKTMEMEGGINSLLG